jgi:hypothetical protein
LSKNHKPITVEQALYGPKPKLGAVQINDHKTGHHFIFLPLEQAKALRAKQARQGYGSNLRLNK